MNLRDLWVRRPRLPRSPADVPRWATAVSVVSVAIVAGVAAVVSYVHVLTLARLAGEGWRAWLVPLSVDGLLVAASMVMLVRRRAGRRAGPLPWLSLILGLGASLGANVAAAWVEDHRDPLSLVISAWPAAALFLAFELLISVLRDAAPGSSPADDAPGDGPGEPVVTSGGAVGRRKLAQLAGVSEHQARVMLDALKATSNGAGG